MLGKGLNSRVLREGDTAKEVEDIEALKTIRIV